MENSVKEPGAAMKIAIPVFENRISPRFDYAPELGVYDIEGQRITGRREISCEGWSDIERVSKLKGFGIDILICGGLPGYLHNILTNSGIRVIPWLAGDVGDALSLFLRGQLNPGMVVCPRRGKRRRCKRTALGKS
jgi:predicted Fe-Mo cluster-binding NifX family protein